MPVPEGLDQKGILKWVSDLATDGDAMEPDQPPEVELKTRRDEPIVAIPTNRPQIWLDTLAALRSGYFLDKIKEPSNEGK